MPPAKPPLIRRTPGTAVVVRAAMVARTPGEILTVQKSVSTDIASLLLRTRDLEEDLQRSRDIL